jgi:chromosome segregation ATPase
MRYYYYCLGLALYFILPIAAQKPVPATPLASEINIASQDFEALVKEVKDLKSEVRDLEEDTKATKIQLESIRQSLASLSNGLSSAVDLTNMVAKPSQLTTNPQTYKGQTDVLSHQLKQKLFNLQHDISTLQMQIVGLMSMAHHQQAQK